MKGLITGLLLLACSGCATYFARDSSNLLHKEGIYPATRLDLKPFEDNLYELFPFTIVDIPFSLVFDTLMFPYDYYRASRSVCNNFDNKDKLEQYITHNKNDANIKQVTIMQMHQRYDAIFVEYRFDASSDIYVSLYGDYGNSFKQGPFLVHSDKGVSKEIIKKYFLEKIVDNYRILIDCYK